MNNPVLRKELFMKLRLRQLHMSSRIALLGVGAALLGVIYYFVIVKWIIEDPNSRSGLNAWQFIVGIQAALICLIAPAVAANSITQEKEQQTWDMLISTRLRPGEIICGKLMARTTFLALLLLLFVPIEIFCWMKSYQFISATMILLSYLTLIITAVFFSTFGLYMSWLLNRTIYAIMSAYSFVIGGLVVGTMLITSMLADVSLGRFIHKVPSNVGQPGNDDVRGYEPEGQCEHGSLSCVRVNRLYDSHYANNMANDRRVPSLRVLPIEAIVTTMEQMPQCR